MNASKTCDCPVRDGMLLCEAVKPGNLWRKKECKLLCACQVPDQCISSDNCRLPLPEDPSVLSLDSTWKKLPNEEPSTVRTRIHFADTVEPSNDEGPTNAMTEQKQLDPSSFEDEEARVLFVIGRTGCLPVDDE